MTNMRAMVWRAVLCVGAIAACSAVRADQILASAHMTQSLSGSLNSIAGSSTLVGGQIHLPVGSTLTRVEFELLSFSSNPSLVMPQSIGINFRYVYPNTSITDDAGVAFSNLQGIQLGSIISIDPFAVPHNFSNPLLGLFDSFGQNLPILQASASWSFGGVDASAQSEIGVRAYGTPDPNLVAEPSTIALALIALVGVGRCRRNVGPVRRLLGGE